MAETPKTSKPRATKAKRHYTPPAITSTTAAFEHAVLACNGTVAGGRIGSCGGKVGSTCVTVCTPSS